MDRVTDVVLVILERDVHGLTHVDVGGEVHDDFDVIFFQNLGDNGSISEIFIKEGDVIGNGSAVAVNEVIKDKRGVTSGLELSDAVTTNVACTSYDENVHRLYGDRVSELSQELNNSAFYAKQTL